MEKKLLPYLVVISALSVSLSAAFYSVTGIGKMFSGSSTNVMIMMASLEIAKLILASLLYQYWGKLNNLLKLYYFIAIFTLMIITSAGIYGYLSSAYSETAYKVENVDKQVGVLDVKRKMFETQLNDIRLEKQRLTDNIADLTKGLSNNNQTYKDKSGNILTTTSSANRKTFEGQLTSAQKRRDDLSIKETALNDSITKIDLQKLDLETNADLAGEVGPLKYISKLTNKPMDVVVNWFIIALMLVFDPLAVSLVIGANVIFADKKKLEEKIDLSKQIDEKIENFKTQEKEFEEKKLEFETLQKEIEQKEKEFDKKILKAEKELTEKEKKLISEYEEKERTLEDSINEREEFLETRFNDLEKQIQDKEIKMISEYDTKEKELEINYLERKNQLETRFSSQNKELGEKLKEANLTLENLQKEEDKLRDKIRTEENRLQKLEIELMAEKEAIKDEKKVIANVRKELDRQTKTLQEDKSDLELEISKLEDIKEELAQKESQIEVAKEEILRIDAEIKAWENQHWKMKRNPPSSAILD
jgi:chromosome segregation ATPase